MTQFSFGVIVGIVLSASVGLAGNFYDSKEQPSAPAGSIQSFYYFRSRQQQLDVSAMRRQVEQDRLHRLVQPCAK